MSLILNNFGSEWMPVFERDRDSQRAAAAPYSDAYLTGMPARKRRCVRAARPATALDALINESISEVSTAGQSAPTGPDHESMRAAFREQIRALTRTRAASDSDYSSERYSAVMRFLGPKRSERNTGDSSKDRTK